MHAGLVGIHNLLSWSISPAWLACVHGGRVDIHNRLTWFLSPGWLAGRVSIDQRVTWCLSPAWLAKRSRVTQGDGCIDGGRVGIDKRLTELMILINVLTVLVLINVDGGRVGIDQRLDAPPPGWQDRLRSRLVQPPPLAPYFGRVCQLSKPRFPPRTEQSWY